MSLILSIKLLSNFVLLIKTFNVFNIVQFSVIFSMNYYFKQLNFSIMYVSHSSCLWRFMVRILLNSYYYLEILCLKGDYIDSKTDDFTLDCGLYPGKGQ